MTSSSQNLIGRAAGKQLAEEALGNPYGIDAATAAAWLRIGPTQFADPDFRTGLVLGLMETGGSDLCTAALAKLTSTYLNHPNAN